MAELLDFKREQKLSPPCVFCLCSSVFYTDRVTIFFKGRTGLVIQFLPLSPYMPPLLLPTGSLALNKWSSSRVFYGPLK